MTYPFDDLAEENAYLRYEYPRKHERPWRSANDPDAEPAEDDDEFDADTCEHGVAFDETCDECEELEEIEQTDAQDVEMES